ncbi:MAG: hypothetical protein QOK40_1581 [Miltoncostaeaceae bacterium]|nr:hypothetical protein [Miltoncostaeaceae bacterium]
MAPAGTRPSFAGPIFSLAPQHAARWGSSPSVHRIPPPRRAEVLASLQPLERLLLGRVCCDCSTLSNAARQLGISTDDAQRLWRRVATLIASAGP